jgi:hypothetical protein
MLNRRKALTAAATLPALAVPLAVAGAMPDASERKLLALEAEIYQAWEHLGSKILETAENAQHEWNEQNPRPTMRDPTKAESRTLRLGFANDERVPSFGEEYERDEADHKRALAEWEARHEAAKEDTGYNLAHELEEEANERLDEAIMAMCDAPATTLEGLRCKARAAAKVDDRNLDSDLAWSIVEDLAGETRA